MAPAVARAKTQPSLELLYIAPGATKEDKTMALNYDKIQKQAKQAHEKAKNGEMKFNGVKYVFTVDRKFGTYTITNEEGVVTYLNTRKITVAKKWLREFLQN